MHGNESYKDTRKVVEKVSIIVSPQNNAAQQSVHPTGGTLRHVSAPKRTAVPKVSPRPARQQVTQTVGVNGDESRLSCFGCNSAAIEIAPCRNYVRSRQIYP